MTCKWIVENQVFPENQEEILNAITNLGMEYKVIDYRPFEASEEKLKNLFPKEPVVCYCSLEMANTVLKKTNHNPGVYCNFPEFECTQYYNYFSNYLLNNDYVMLPFGELQRSKNFLFKIFGENLFIRPSSGRKYFTGECVSPDDYDYKINRFGFYDIPKDKMVVISTAKPIEAEWRLMVIDKKVIASSQYKDKQQSVRIEGCPIEVKTLAEEIAQIWQPEKAFVIDMCKSNNELKLVEINSFCSSGWYKANIHTIVEKLSECAIKDFQEKYE